MHSPLLRGDVHIYIFQVGMPIDRPVGSSSSQTSNRPDTLNGAGGGAGARKSVPVGATALTTGGDEDYKDFKGNVSAPPASKPSSGLAQQARYKPLAALTGVHSNQPSGAPPAKQHGYGYGGGGIGGGYG